MVSLLLPIWLPQPLLAVLIPAARTTAPDTESAKITFAFARMAIMAPTVAFVRER